MSLLEVFYGQSCDAKKIEICILISDSVSIDFNAFYANSTEFLLDQRITVFSIFFQKSGLWWNLIKMNFFPEDCGKMKLKWKLVIFNEN